MAWSSISSPVSGTAISIANYGQKVIDNLQYLYDLVGATGTAWTSYTPTWGGAVTLGSGTNVGAYQRFGKTVHWRASFTFGSGSAVGSATATVTLPVTAISSTPPGLVTVYFFDTSATTYFSALAVYGTTTVTIYEMKNNGNGNDDSEVLNSTEPFTWATGDQIVVAGTYEAA